MSCFFLLLWRFRVRGLVCACLGFVGSRLLKQLSQHVFGWV